MDIVQGGWSNEDNFVVRDLNPQMFNSNNPASDNLIGGHKYEWNKRSGKEQLCVAKQKFSGRNDGEYNELKDNLFFYETTIKKHAHPAEFKCDDRRSPHRHSAGRTCALR